MAQPLLGHVEGRLSRHHFTQAPVQQIFKNSVALERMQLLKQEAALRHRMPANSEGSCAGTGVDEWG